MCVTPVAELMISAGVFFFFFSLLHLIVLLTIAVNDSPEWLHGSTAGGGEDTEGKNPFSKAYMVFVPKPVCNMASGCLY